jgi:uncharacterized protein (DUF58 family)
MQWFATLWNRWRFRAERTVPTVRLVLYTFFAGVGWFLLADVAAAWQPILFIALVLGVLVTAVDWLLSRRQVKPSVKREWSDVPQIGVPLRVQVTVQFPLASAPSTEQLTKLQVDYGLPLNFHRIGQDEIIFESDDHNLRVTSTAQLVPTKRGRYALDEVDVAWVSPLGLWRRMYRSTVGDVLTVYPDLTTWRKPVTALQRSLLQEGRHVKKLISGNTEFSHIAEYGPDDDPRMMNWSATARRGRLMKNVYQPERGQQLLIAVDLSRYMGVHMPDGKTRLDYAVACAAALAETALAAGDSVGLIAFASQVVDELPPGRGTRFHAEFMNRLAGLTSSPVQGGYEALFAALSGHFHRRSMLVVLSELEGVLSDVGFFPSLASIQRRHSTLFVTLTDIMSESVLHSEQQDSKNAFRMAAAEYILENREKMVRALRLRDVSVVESPPGDVVIDIVRAYLERKRKYAL